MKLIFLPPRNWDIKLVQDITLSNDTFNHLISLGAEVEIIPPTLSKNRFFKNINPFIMGIDIIRALRVLIFRRKADCVISICESGGLIILLLRRVFLFRPKVLLWDLSANNKWRLVQIIQKMTLPRYDGFMLLTTAQQEYLQKFNYPGKQTLIYYNVDEEFFTPQHGIVGDYILAIGDDLSRDYDVLVQALADLDFNLLIKTNYHKPKVPAGARLTLKLLSERLNLKDYRELIANARILVLPLHKVVHAGGITFLFEAMALGKPLVITKSSLSDDFLEDRINCLIVPAGDRIALRTAILEFQNDPNLRERCGVNIRKALEQSWTTRDLAIRIKNFCNSLKN